MTHTAGWFPRSSEQSEDSSFLYNLWELPLLPPAAAALTPGDSEGHDCYPLTDILRVNASVCSGALRRV
jgi:hypothetical protein